MASLSRFSVDDLEVLSRALRAYGEGDPDMCRAAELITGHLDASLRDERGRPSCAAITLHKTHRFDGLPHDLQVAARAVDPSVDAGTSCLVLLAAVAESDAARPQTPALPLTDQVYGERPVLLSLLSAMGLDRTLLADPAEVVLRGIHRTELEAFVLRDIAGTEWLTDEEREALRALDVEMLLTIGGALPTGDIFLLSVFSHEPVDDRAAWVFRTLAPAIKAALIPHALRPWTAG